MTTPAFDSMTIGDTIEILGPPGGVQSPIPELQNAAGQGVVFQLLAPPGGGGGAATSFGMSYDLGAPQPTQDIVQSLLLDGERPFGYRASNREIHLPVKITAPDFVTMAAARELLMQVVDQQTWTLTWTPVATGLPLEFDCFRALPTIISYGFLNNRFPVAVVTLHFQALPYGRSDVGTGLQQVAFSSPLLGGVAAPPAAVVLDNFGTVSGANWSQSSVKYVVGPNSARFTPPGNAPRGYACAYTRSGLPTLNITGLPVLSVWFGQSYDTAHFAPWPAFVSNITLAWTLTDNASHTISFHRTYNKCRWSNSAANPAWTRITAVIPQNVAGFNYGAITAYSVRISNGTFNGQTLLARMNAWMDAVTANPPSIAAAASQRGVIYTIMGAAGTARTPFSAQFQLPQSGSVQSELTGSGVWWPPLGVTSVQAECVGAGGAGASRTTVGLGGGGGGGEYAREPSLTVSAGTPVPYACGAAGSPGDSQHVVTFTTPGTGNWLVPAGVTAVKAECWGSGAGGAPGGGGGGGGEYAMEPSLTVTPGARVPFTIGAGGSGGGAGGGTATVQQRNGQTTTFGSAATTTTVVTAHGGSTGLLGGTTAGGGGFGSTNSTHFSGGAGGTSPGNGGGGGGSAGTAANGNLGGNGSGNTGGTGASAVTGGGAGGAGANAPGYPGAGAVPGGGGGGGYSTNINAAGANGAGGQVRITYVAAAGNPVAGAATTFGSAGTTGTVVRANGGTSAALNSATGGAGGTGSTNSVHFNGGAGWTTTALGGGGGGSGGSASAGNAATSQVGAAAVTGGGKGVNGAAAADQGGQAAAPPGGGGGGADMGTTAQTGGLGGGGAIWLTWTPPLQAFGTLIAHRPGQDAPENLNPCVPVLSTSDPPDGRQYAIPQVISGVNSLFRGTYSILLMNYVWDNPTASRQITVTVYQYEYPGGPAWSVQLIRTLTPSTDITNGLIVMGELTLPVKDMDPSNTSGYYAVSVNDTDQNDQFLDVLFLDTQGQTVIINIPPGNTYSNFFIDEPTSDRDIGRIMGSDLDRSQAISCLDSCIISGGPFYLLPGDNTFLCYTPLGAPNLGVTYLPRWYSDRIS